MSSSSSSRNIKSAKKATVEYLNYVSKQEKEKKPNMKKVGVTTLIASLAKSDKSWRGESARFRRRYNFNSDNNKISRQHDSYIALHDALYNTLGFKFIGKEVHLQDSHSKVIHKSEVKILHGYIDMLLKRSDGRFAILDIKTTKSKTVTLMHAVTKQKHELQLRLYAYLLKKVYNLNYTPSCYLCGIRLKDKDVDVKNVKLRRERTGDLVIWEIPLEDKDLISIDRVFSIWQDNYSKPTLPTEF
jgi:ATP-dependent exoDNAse (exonuclease V) beta subunit